MVCKEKTKDMSKGDPKIRYTKISVQEELPSEDGKYIVFTESTSVFKTINCFRTTFNTRENKGVKKHNWGCTNQIVTHWLKED